MLETKPNGIMLSLPFPDPILNPNAHVHWSKKNRARYDLKEACYYLILERGVKLDPDRHYTVSLTFCPPNNRKRDRDNLLAAYKAGLDGMCLALGIDDSTIHPVPEIGPVVSPLGKVEVSIVEKIGT